MQVNSRHNEKNIINLPWINTSGGTRFNIKCNRIDLTRMSQKRFIIRQVILSLPNKVTFSLGA